MPGRFVLSYREDSSLLLGWIFRSRQINSRVQSKCGSSEMNLCGVGESKARLNFEGVSLDLCGKIQTKINIYNAYGGIL